MSGELSRLTLSTGKGGQRDKKPQGFFISCLEERTPLFTFLDGDMLNAILHFGQVISWEGRNTESRHFLPFSKPES